jgi:hypothetical protein
VPGDATWCDVSDAASAYLGLPDLAPGKAGDTLMLLWDLHNGWTLEVDDPLASSAVLASLGGDVAARPHVVSAFVHAVIEGRTWTSSPLAGRDERPSLTVLLADYLPRRAFSDRAAAGKPDARVQEM